MAINQPPFNQLYQQNPGQQDPALTYQDPIAYAMYLRTKGLNPYQVQDLVSQRFGPGKSPQDRQKDAAAAQQKAAFGQTAGTLAGAVGVTQLPKLFGPAAVAETGAETAGAVAQPTLLGGADILGGATGIGAETGATTTGATTAGSSTLGAIGSYALPIAAAAAVLNNAWETGMKDIVRGKGTRADWINQGVNVLGGAVPNIALRLLGKRSIGAMMTSGKSDAQKLRDSFRNDLRESGVASKIDGSDHVTLADGTKFNIGLDGKTKYQNVGENIDGKKTRNAWDVDFSNPLAKFATDKLDPTIRNIYGADDPKRKFFPGQYTGMLVNAVTSNAKNEQDVLANIQAVLGKSKFAEQAGVGVTPPPPPRPPKGEVVRVSPGMYMNDQGHINPAKTVGQALRMNYQKGKEKK